MRAIKIDVVKMDCYYVEQDSIIDIYKHIECECFCQVGKAYPNHDTLLVDDEGRLVFKPGAFRFGTYHEILFGNGLLVGNTPEGESDHVKNSLEYVKSIVQFGIMVYE